MFNFAKKALLTAALGATVLSSASPALAGDHRRHRNDDVTGTILLGVLTVAAIAVLTGGDDDRNQRCDGGPRDPDFCYGRRDTGSHPAARGQVGYAQSTEYEDDSDYRQGDYRQESRYEDNDSYEAADQSDEYDQGSDDSDE